MIKPPKEMLGDTIEYAQYVGQGDWNKAEYAVSVTIEHVRIDREVTYSFDNSSKELLYTARIYCYNELSDPLPVFVEQSKVVFDNKEHTVVRVMENRSPFKNEVYSYELEVI